MVAAGLLAEDVVRVDNLPPDERGGSVVRNELRGKHGVDREVESVQGREEQLRGTAGKGDGLGKGTECAERLEARALLGGDRQPATLDRDRRVEEPQDVGL